MRVRAAIVAAILSIAGAAWAATPQEQIEARRQVNPRVEIHVITGETLRGTVERAMPDEFYIANENGIDRILVPYFAVKELIDPDTGETIAFDAPKEPPLSTAAAVREADKAAAASAASAGSTGAPARTRSGLPITWLFAIGGVAAMWYAFSRIRK